MRSRFRTLLVFAVAGGLSACAPLSGQIAPDPIPPEAYAATSCRDLALMRARTNRTLILSEVIQDKYYADDRIRTFGIPTPMATLFGEGRAAEVAQLKGESLALAAQIERAGCVPPTR